MSPYQLHHLNFLKIAYNNFIKQPAFTLEEIATEDEQFILDLQQLISDFEKGEIQLREQGQDLLERTFRMYPELAHLLARDLLWYFGGSCLHNMPDAEIAQFQKLEETYFKALEDDKQADYLSIRADIFGLN